MDSHHRMRQCLRDFRGKLLSEEQIAGTDYKSLCVPLAPELIIFHSIGRGA